MSSISSIPKAHFHARSFSLPSRLSQTIEFDDLQATTSSSSIGQQINGLKDLYNSFDNILAEDQNNGVNELLDELLQLLELCSTTKDSWLSTRDSAQQLQSVLRRKRGDYNRITCAVQEYQSKRKAVKKTIVKALRNLKGSSIKKIQEKPFRNMESLTLTVLESLLCFILGSTSQKNSNKCSLVSKMLGPKQSTEESLVGKVDIELSKKLNCLKIENLQKELSKMELILEDVEEGESLCRVVCNRSLHKFCKSKHMNTCVQFLLYRNVIIFSKLPVE